MKKAFDLTVKILKKDSTSIEWKYMYTKRAIHSNNALLSVPVGLNWILKTRHNKVCELEARKE